MTTSQLSSKQKALVAQLDQAVASARVTGHMPSEYFLDKCSAEAGDTSEPRKATKVRPARTPWAVLVDSTWFARLRKH